jgi:Rho GTPase-activating protein 39
MLLVTFPLSKNCEPYLHAFLSQRTFNTEGCVDVLAKHCPKRLAAITTKKGVRGVPPILAEIETA